MKFNCLSLFSSAGIAETYFEKNGFNLLVANELIPERAKLHKILYPKCDVIVGDITKDKVFKKIILESVKNNINFVIATPPCQGMSTAGKKIKYDKRNRLIIPTVEVILTLKPSFVIIENVPEILNTKIIINKKEVFIKDYIFAKLGKFYNINKENKVNAMYYNVPQSRERCIFLLVKKEFNFTWEFPKKNKPITMKAAIGSLPSVDPEITDADQKTIDNLFPDFENKAKKAKQVSVWHIPPKHKLRHVIAMLHTPEGHSAWENEYYYPKLKNGEKSKGYKNTYKRQWWNKPAYTITKYTSRLGSQENGHPGRLIKNDGTEEGRLYSEPRTMTIYELMILSSLPKDWEIPLCTSTNLIREVIGEGVPPKLIEACLKELKNKL